MDYSTFRIGDICEMVKGEYPTLKTLPGGYPLVVTAEQRRSADTYQLDRPSVCVPLISSTGHGDAALNRLHYQEGKYAVANLLVALLPKDSTMCDPKYLYHLLNTKKDEYFVPLMRGTSNVSLKIKDIATVQIPLPPLSEQRRIVGRLEHLASKIEEAQGLQIQSFEIIDTLIASYTRRLLNNLSEQYDPIPLLEFCDFKGGSQPPKHTFLYEATKGYVRFLQIRDFSSDANITYIPESSRNQIARPEDVLVGRYGASIGKILRGKSGAYNVAMTKAVPRGKDIDLDFLALALQYGTFQDCLASVSRSAQVGFNKADLADVVYSLPSNDEQRLIASSVNNFRSKVDGLRQLQVQTRGELDALLPSVLDKAFRGEL